ncbi:hypothetical protein ABH945_007016 [Paraburkholderia sp. GAS333]
MSKQDNESRAVILSGGRMSNPIVDLEKSRPVFEYENLILEPLAELGATIAQSV